MPNINPQQNNNSLYADIDEVLAAPPSRLVKYGNTVLLAVLLILLTISFFLKYNDGINEPATICSMTDVMTNSTNEKTTIQKVFVQGGMIVRAGDTLISASNESKVKFIITPISGKIVAQRKIVIGDILQPSTPLFLIISNQEKYAIKINISPVNSQKMVIGQRATIIVDKYPKEQFGVLNAVIISLPYKDKSTNTFVADAVIINLAQENFNKKMPPLIDESCIAYIVTDSKRLLSKFIKF